MDGSRESDGGGDKTVKAVGTRLGNCMQGAGEKVRGSLHATGQPLVLITTAREPDLE